MGSGGVEMTDFAIKMTTHVKNRKMNFSIFTLGKVDGKEKIMTQYASGRYLVRKKKEDEEPEYVNALLQHCKKISDDEKDSEVECVVPKKKIDNKKIHKEVHKWKNDEKFSEQIWGDFQTKMKELLHDNKKGGYGIVTIQYLDGTTWNDKTCAIMYCDDNKCALQDKMVCAGAFNHVKNATEISSAMQANCLGDFSDWQEVIKECK